MERTLDPAVLASALGDVRPGGVLPSPDELLQAIADLEVAAFRAEQGIRQETLATAWLLHGLAAMEEGTPGYDRVRMRNALAVSAHVLDLALGDSRLSQADRLQIAFAAQAGYRRCEQDPNATAVYRRVAGLVRTEVGIEEHIDTLAVEAGVAFLGLDRPVLTRALRVWRRQFAGLRALMGRESMAGTMYGPAEAVVEALHRLHLHLAFGDEAELQAAREQLRAVVEQRAGRGDRLARWVAAHFLELSGELAASSLHILLPSGTPAAVAQTFALSSPPVLTLWPPQRKLLRLERGNPMDPETRRSLISVPTSAGKTLMAQLVICSHLAQRPGRVLYVSPMRSLGREMRAALRSRLRLLGRRLAAERPDFPVVGIDFAARGPLAEEVEILTPERLMHMIRNNSETTLDDVGLIVIDEAHHLAQGKRGFVLESLLAFLAAGTAETRLVLLSAAVGNKAQLASWLDPSQPLQEVYFSDTWRGPRRLHGLIYPHLLKEQAERKARTPTTKNPSATKATVPVAMRLTVRPTAGPGVANLVTGPVGPRAFAESDPDRWTARTKQSPWTPDYEVFAAGAAALVEAGSVLMVVDTKVAARNTALAIAKHLEERPQAAELTGFLTDTLGAEHPLVSCARKGVAYHHGDLPDDVLRAIEDALRADQLVAVACTSTLTEGVNLPVRTVIVNTKVGEDRLTYENQRRLLPAELLNAVGRAGRAGRESEGWILLARPHPPRASDFASLTPSDDQLTVTSALLSERALAELADAEDRLRTDADNLFTLANTVTADFVSFVWFILCAQETTPTLSSERGRLDAVSHLLAMQQADDPAIPERWMMLAQQVAVRYDRTDTIIAGRWSTTGTSLHSARVLDDLAQRLASALAAEQPLGAMQLDEATVWLAGPQEWPLDRTLDFLTEHRVFEQLLDLPEVAEVWHFTSQERRGTDVDVPITDAVRSWMSGRPIPALARAWTPDVPNDWALEQAVRNISNTFEHALSWTLGALINLVSANCSRDPWAPRLNGRTAWFVRHGVDTEQALTLLTSGITSRRLAHLAGRHAARNNIAPTDLRTWMAAQHIGGWIAEYAANPYEIEDLLDYVRTPSDLLKRLFNGEAVSVPVRRLHAAEGNGRVTLRRPGSDQLAAIAILIDGRRVAVVPADRHLDVLAMLDSGLEIDHHLMNDSLIVSAPLSRSSPA
ncbi:DEAD/DEAH box helicase [Streptomyces sp. NPDC002535]